MSCKAKVITFIIGFVLVVLGVLLLGLFAPWIGAAISFVGIMCMAIIIATAVQDAVDEEIDETIEYRRKVNEMYEMMKKNKTGGDGDERQG